MRTLLKAAFCFIAILLPSFAYGAMLNVGTDYGKSVEAFQVTITSQTTTPLLTATQLSQATAMQFYSRDFTVYVSSWSGAVVPCAGSYILPSSTTVQLNGKNTGLIYLRTESGTTNSTTVNILLWKE